MAEPTNMTDYYKKFREHTVIKGFGFDTTMRVPCPFCAEPDFMVYKILEVEEATQKDTTCKHCGRSCKAIYTSNSPDHKAFEVVQTGGPDQPEWFAPKMRRIDDNTPLDPSSK